MTVVLGVLNVTPDSFSDGGLHLRLPEALAHARAMRAAGADLVDVGGESTRPGADRVPTDEEQRRVVPVIEALAAEGVPTSIDTMNAATALAAVAAGATTINDVSGGLADPAMPAAMAEAAAAGCDVIAMHWRGPSAGMDALAVYGDVVRDVRDELAARRDALVAAGVPAQRIVLDPGLGFAKTAEHNWALLRDLGALLALGHRVLVGASRKRFLRALAGEDCPALDTATAATSLLAARAGAWGVRVHDVAGTRAALAVDRAWTEDAS